MRQRLILSLIALTLHIGAWAALSVGDTFTADGITYKVTSVNPMEVAVGNGESQAINRNITGSFEIPSLVKDINSDEYSVTSISHNAFLLS